MLIKLLSEESINNNINNNNSNNTHGNYSHNDICGGTDSRNDDYESDRNSDNDYRNNTGICIDQRWLR